MSQLVLANLCAGLDLVALIAYAVLGGADFGAGVWDLLARGPTADRQRAAVAHAIGPVWEANNVWLVFVLVVTWTAFPIVYAGLSEALFIPLTLVLVGIVFRGSAYAFRWQYGGQGRFWGLWGRAFSVASTVTPFMLGAAAGAIAGGDIHIHNGVAVADFWATWLTPFALSCGAFAVGLCSVLAATYLTVEALNSGDTVLREVFRQRAIVSGAVTALIGAIAALLARSESPVLWSGLIGSALPLSLGAVLIGLATAYCLLAGYYRVARLLVAGEATCILLAWAVAQYPYLIIPDVTLQNAAASVASLSTLLIFTAIGLVILLPSLWYLFRVFKSAHPMQPTASVAEFVKSLGQADIGGAAGASGRRVQTGQTADGSVVPGALLVAASVALATVWDTIRRRRRGPE
jgi:cytochrome d ubiquinol oxidase subunit II